MTKTAPWFCTLGEGKDLTRVSARAKPAYADRLQPRIRVVTQKSKTLRVPRVESGLFSDPSARFASIGHAGDSFVRKAYNK